MDELIQKIAAEHGVVIGKDDPILMVYTLNEHLISKNKKAYDEVLCHFKEDIEQMSSNWRQEANEKAQKILNTSLAASKEVMHTLMKQSTHDFLAAMNAIFDETLISMRRIEVRAKKYAVSAWMGTGLTLLFIVCWGLYTVY